MIDKDNQPNQGAGVRLKAEEVAREYPDLFLEKIKALSPEGIQQIIHDLKVQQIELELKNEELVQTQAEQEAARDRFVNFYDLSPVDSFILNEQGLILEANFSTDNLLSVPRCTLARQPLTRFILPEDQKVFCFHLKELFKTNVPRAYEIRMLKKDGPPFWVQMEIFLIRHAVGTPQCHTLIRNISEHKWSHAAEIEREKHFRMMVEKAPDIFFIHDYRGKFLYVNEQVRNKLGYTQEELLNMNAQDIQQTLSFEQLCSIWDSLEDGESSAAETELLRKDGGVFPVEIRISSLVASTNERIFLGIVHDISDLKQVEEVLRDERWRLQSIIEGASVGTWEWNVQTGETVFNMMWAQMLGYTLDELSPISIKTWEALVHPDDMQLSSELLERHFAGELPYYTCICRMKHKAGQWIWIQDSGRIINRTADGKPLMMFGIHTEITERKRAEKALQESEAKHRILFENANDAIFIVDMEARLLAANPMAERHLGYTHSELMSMTVHQVSSPKGGQMVQERMASLMDHGHQTFESEHLHKDGSLIPVEISSRRITWDGQPAIHSICRNISERKKAEELIHDSEQRFRAAFIGNPVAACITRQQDAVWIDANQAELDLFGYTREEFIGKSALETNIWVDPSDRQRIVEAVNRGEAVRSKNVQLRCKDGRLISASVSATGLTLKGVKHTLFVTEDITERRLADEKIKAALLEKEVLLREVHHRVKNNMQVVSSLLFLQASRMEKEQGRQALLESQQRILAMAMTHEVLYSGQNLAAIDLSVYLRHLVDQLQGAYSNQSDIRVVLEADHVEIDINQAVPCSLIFNELITNAFKHAFPDGRKGTVRIRVYLSHDKEVVLELSDNGVGFVLDQDLSKPSSLGLKLIRRLLMKQLKGRMDMTTEGGTTFTLRWPLPVKSASKLTV